MCGIFAYIGKKLTKSKIKSLFNNVKPRGPDFSELLNLDDNISIGFHRLSINDTSSNGNQPLYHPKNKNIVVICNGEIYNFKELIKEFNITDYKSGSDCEILVWLYEKIGIDEMIKKLDGVFSFVIFDFSKKKLYAGRDPYGVRPMFIGQSKDSIGFSSEMKGISELDNVEQFKPGCWLEIDYINDLNTSLNDKYIRYHNYIYNIDNKFDDINQYCDIINKTLKQSVQKRLLSDRKIGCLLSGGVDSSLIAALVAKNYAKGELETFSIGIKGAVDLKYAKMVADHIGSKHHQIELTEKDMLDAIPTVIQSIESWDTTSVRASVPNYLVSKYISENSDCKVIFQGDGMDEVAGSYLYLSNAPDENSFHNECQRLLEEIHMFDVLRADRTISDHGLEPRTPFLDKAFVKNYMSIPEKFRMHGDKIEKYLLRKAFDHENLLPTEVLWRRKEAFSDGCSSKEKSWYHIIQEYVDTFITDEDFINLQNNYTTNKPLLKESLYYRVIFDRFYKHPNVIKHYWMPKWTKNNMSDPSARLLHDVYEKDFDNSDEKNTINITI